MNTTLTLENDPYPKFDSQLDEGPIVWSDDFNAWLVGGIEEAKQIASDLETYSVARGYRDSKGASFKSILGTAAEKVTTRLLRYLDPPEWDKIRWAHEAAVPYLYDQPPATQPEELRMAFREIAVGRLEASIGKTHIEAMQEWCTPIPCLGTVHVLGLPPEDFPQLYDWVVGGALMVFRFPTDRAFWSEENVKRCVDSSEKLIDYFLAAVEKRRSRPSNDFISKLLQYNKEKKAELTDDDLALIPLTHIIGGFHESAFQVLGHGIYQLLSTGQYQQLVDDPTKATACVDEILRFHAPAPLAARRANKDVTVSGVDIKKDDFVFVNFGAAQRDACVYKNPREFDINRPNNANGDTSFGYGPHKCTGRTQVKLMSTIFFEVLARTYPNLGFNEWPENAYMTLRNQPRADVTLLESLSLKLR